MKKLLVGLLALWMVVLLAGCAKDPRKGEAKTFTNEGISITLTDVFRKTDVEGFAVAYDSSKVGVLVTKEAFADIPNADTLTLEDYAQLVLNVNEDKTSEVKNTDGLTYLEYVAKSNGKNYGYLVCMYRGTDAFWLVQFAVPESDFSDYRASLVDWAKTVTFS